MTCIVLNSSFHFVSYEFITSMEADLTIHHYHSFAAVIKNSSFISITVVQIRLSFFDAWCILSLTLFESKLNWKKKFIQSICQPVQIYFEDLLFRFKQNTIEFTSRMTIFYKTYFLIPNWYVHLKHRQSKTKKFTKLTLLHNFLFVKMKY